MSDIFTPPRDATGCPIPLNVNVLYEKEGTALEVLGFSYLKEADPNLRWSAEIRDYTDKGAYTRYEPCTFLYIEKPTPDSYYKLTNDIQRAIYCFQDREATKPYAPECRYFWRDRLAVDTDNIKQTDYCNKNCPGFNDDCCTQAMLEDIVTRMQMLDEE